MKTDVNDRAVAATHGGCVAVDIIIPFYRNAQLVSSLCDSLLRSRDELAAMSCTVVAVNDSPEDAELRGALAAARVKAEGQMSFDILENDENLGFVRSVNRAIRGAMKRSRDVILLNSDTIVFPGALQELAAIAYLDPMIGFVSPRSNNATLCSLPQQREFHSAGPVAAHLSFLALSTFLPRYHFVPTAVGFCLYIRREIFNEFGLFDTAYGAGYNEENDLIMRANRCGYRAALANHAFVYHMGEQSFGGHDSPNVALNSRNAELLSQRYPEYLPMVRKYLDGPHYEAEALLNGLLRTADGRLDIVVDFSSVGQSYNGTAEFAKEILRRAPAHWTSFKVHVMASDATRRFHRLDEIDGVLAVPLTTKRKFAVAVRLGQPFSHEQLDRMSRLAPVNIYAMLDPIAYDCLHLNALESNLEEVWAHVFLHADGVFYISDFVQKLFRNRFARRPGLIERVTYLSLDFREYREGQKYSVGGRDEGYVLVIGNAFPHKRVAETVDRLSEAFPQERIVALGLVSSTKHNVVAYESGHLTNAAVDRLMAGARFIIFPSVYEGFGLPILRGLAYGKPILARHTPVAEAIRDRTDEIQNLVLYSSPQDLIDRLRMGFPTWIQGDREHVGNTEASWPQVVDQMGETLLEAVNGLTFEHVVSRLRQLAWLAASPAFVGQQELDLLRQLMRSPRHRVANTLAHAIQRVPVVWSAIARATEVILAWERRRKGDR